MARCWSWNRQIKLLGLNKNKKYKQTWKYKHLTSCDLTPGCHISLSCLRYQLHNKMVYSQLPSIKLQAGLHTQTNTVIDEPTEMYSLPGKMVNNDTMLCLQWVIKTHQALKCCRTRSWEPTVHQQVKNSQYQRSYFNEGRDVHCTMLKDARHIEL